MCALVSEILESVLQTVQKQFTYRQYICQDIYSITRLEVFRTTFIEAFVGLQVSSDAQTGTVRIILKNDLLSSRGR